MIAACRRYPRGRGQSFGEAGIRRVLRKSRIETRTKVAAITVSQGADVLQRLGDVVEELLDENLLCRVIQVSRGTVDPGGRGLDPAGDPYGSEKASSSAFGRT